MKNLLNKALLTTLILTVAYSVIAFGAATLELAGPLFGAASLLAILWAAKLFANERVSWIKSPAHWPVLAFVAYAGIRYLTSPVEYDSRIEFCYICFYAVIYFVVACNLYHRRDLTIVFLALMVLALGESIYGIWQAVTLNDRILFAERPPGIYTGRASGTFTNPNHFAAFLSIVFGVVLARIVLHRPAAKAAFGAYAGPKILEGYVALVALAGIIASGSRGSSIALCVGLFAFVLWAWFPGSVSRYVVGGMALLLVLASLVVFNAPSVRERIAELVSISTDVSKDETSVTIKDATLGQRTLMWSASTKIIAEHPIFGTGPGTWEWFFTPHGDVKLQEHPRNAHNDLLQMTAEYGIVGLLIVSVFFAAYFWHTAQLSGFANYSDQRAFAVGTGFAVAVVLLHALADFNFHVPAIAMVLIILMGMGVAMESGDRYSLRVQMSRRNQILIGVALIVIALGGGWAGWRLVATQRMLTAAESLKSTEDFDQAMELYQRVVSRDSKQYTAYKGIGELYVALARKLPAAASDARIELSHRALEALQHSAKLNRLDPEVHMSMGDAYRVLKETSHAIGAYNAAVAIDPNKRSIMVRLGFFYREIGDREKAVRWLLAARNIVWTEDVRLALEAMGVK